MWDVDTVTAADFTVESIISEQMWLKFVEVYGKNLEQNQTLLNKFNEVYQKEVEKVVSMEEGVLSQ